MKGAGAGATSWPTVGNDLLIRLSRIGLLRYFSRHQHMINVVESNVAGPRAVLHLLGAPILGIGLLIVGLMFTLVTGWIVRIGVLVILAGVGPVAMACYSLPWTQGAAHLWWRSLLGCLGTATLQALAFSTGIQLITDPNASLPIRLGLPART